jgi:hypothetical protein
MSEQNRTKRDTENREVSMRPKRWMPAQLLPDPNPEEGYAFHWIRISTLNEDDPRNVSGKLREGWEPVKASDHPEISQFGPGHKSFPGGIEVGGLLLCKTPVEFVEQRSAHFNNQTESQMNSVDSNYMRESDTRMPMFKDRKSSVSFGRGT